MAWWKRSPERVQSGSVPFRGRWAARAQDFGPSLAERGVALLPEERDAEGWTARMEHPKWGTATLIYRPDLPLPPESLIDWDPRLANAEKAEVKQAGAVISVTAQASAGNVLVDRKHLLQFLRAVMGKEGLAAMDHSAQAFWSRGALDDELSHDAELDIEALYTVHAVTEDSAGEERRAYWLHSHGLSEIGFTDFDLLDPDSGVTGHAQDLLRALAYGIVEGRLAPGGAPMPLVDDVQVQLVDSKALKAALPPNEHAKWQSGLDPEHLEGHAVVCDAPDTGLFSRLFRKGQPKPSKFLRGPMPDEVLIAFSHDATSVMERRARQMLPIFRDAFGDLREFELPSLVKLGYGVDGGSGDQREHLWFQVHEVNGDSVDATLLNRPFQIARLKEGDRAQHPLELLSDWAIMTPLGRITPRSTGILRALRGDKDRLRKLFAAMKFLS